MDPNDPTDPRLTENHRRPDARMPWMLLAACVALLCISVAVNLGLWQRAKRAEALPHAPDRTVQAVDSVPAPTTCPPCLACDASAPCPVCPVVAETPRGDGGARTTQPPQPRVDQDLADAGETTIANAADAGERDPVHLGAQRSVMTGVDQIVRSNSAAAAERFLTRTLPHVASMDCEFRDPALAEHVRLQLRNLNNLARPRNRLSEAELTRYERDLRCPRE